MLNCCNDDFFVQYKLRYMKPCLSYTGGGRHNPRRVSLNKEKFTTDGGVRRLFPLLPFWMESFSDPLSLGRKP